MRQFGAKDRDEEWVYEEVHYTQFGDAENP